MSTAPLPVVNVDEDTYATTTVSDGGETVVATRTRLAGGVIGAALAPWYVDASAGGGSVSVVGGAAEIHSGVAAAPRGRIQTRHLARVVLPQANHCTIVASLGSLAAGGRYRFGVFDDSDGFFYEVSGGIASIVTRKAGVDTVYTSPFNVTQPVVVDSLRHVYTIRYLITRAHFFQDQARKHFVASTAVGPLVVNADLPLRAEAENLAAPGTDFILTVANASISRVGESAPGGESSAVTRVATSVASALLIAANPLRRFLVIHNDSVHKLYLKYGATASPSDYTVVLERQDIVTIPGEEWSGRVDGVLDGGTGFAQITETMEV